MTRLTNSEKGNRTPGEDHGQEDDWVVDPGWTMIWLAVEKGKARRPGNKAGPPILVRRINDFLFVGPPPLPIQRADHTDRPDMM